MACWWYRITTLVKVPEIRRLITHTWQPITLFLAELPVNLPKTQRVLLVGELRTYAV